MTFGITDDVTDARAKESFERSDSETRGRKKRAGEAIARREGERIVRAKRDKNKRPIAEIGHEGAKWATAYVPSPHIRSKKEREPDEKKRTRAG